jgi:hypothetical protein
MRDVRLDGLGGNSGWIVRIVFLLVEMKMLSGCFVTALEGGRNEFNCKSISADSIG